MTALTKPVILSLSLSLSLSLTYTHTHTHTYTHMQDEGKRKTAKAAIEAVASSNKFKVLGWRLVPTKPAVLVCLHVYVHARTHTHSKFKVLGWRIYG